MLVLTRSSGSVETSVSGPGGGSAEADWYHRGSLLAHPDGSISYISHGIVFRELIAGLQRDPQFGMTVMLGVGGAKTRHDALELGEARPDYIFFGRIGYDTGAEAHHRNLALGEWWAEMVTLPCIVMGGASIESAAAVAATRADFVALCAAVFAGPLKPGEAVARTNALLDETAPELDAA